MEFVDFVRVGPPTHLSEIPPDWLPVSFTIPTWVQKSDVKKLMGCLKSNEKCICITDPDPASSRVPADDDYSTVSGWVILLINSYRNDKKFSIGLNSCPKGSKDEIKEILSWWDKAKNE